MIKKTKMRGSDKVIEIIMLAVILLIVITVLYPLYYVVVASVSDPYDVYAGKTFFLPSQFTLEGYEKVFRESAIFKGYINSILYTLIGTIVTTALVFITAFPLSRRELPGRNLVMIFYLITMYFTGGLIPTYIVVSKTGLLNSMWALILPGGVSVFNVIVTRTYFESSIPGDVLEAAKIDGCGYLKTFIDIVLPLSKPVMAVMVVFAMVAFWNDWFTALIYMNDKGKYPLQLALRQILVQSEALASALSGMDGGYAEANRITELIKFSSIVVGAAPMLIIYPFVQKYFEKGFMIGAVKG
ncbi:carbohydrate ABC transporter permease [Butyrivibrio sp. MB2005]|uniref:carbohydrate ABC transporter permease n=1 Tax=Butyrivibrio sp. MB2005 TaxID=1280678 RepID=UPI0004254276|nr:carbohydrate ABC transporter permease [Butyrivibrio sp. MB2005]